MIELCMTRGLEEVLPIPELPEGYSLRWYRGGDRDLWTAIQEGTGTYDPMPPGLFEREFGEAPELLPGRQCFVLGPDGSAVGTATAWIPGPGREPCEGRIHWIAVSPEHQRRGLGRFLTATACGRLRELGAASAYLTTGSENHPAVRLYLGLGFLPQPRSDAEAGAWRALLGRQDEEGRDRG